MKRSGSITENATKKSKTSPASAKQALARIKAAAIENDTKLEFSAPNDVLGTLLAPKTTEEFLATYWEKKPMHLVRTNPVYYGTAFTLRTFKQLLKEKELHFEDDVDAFKFEKKDDEKKHLNGTGRLSLEKAEELLTKEKATLVFHQPQRHANIIWNLIEKVESYFGNLVGSTVYVTPNDSQGLAPHCDDTESFIMQLEGTMKWKIYQPKVVLACDFTMDLNDSDIGEPIMELDLKEGDLLYIPRGYIHQSNNATTEHSTRLELSTYSSNCWGDFMNLAVVQALENAMDSTKDVSFRTGMPINYPKFLGTGKNLQKYIEVSKASLESKPEQKEQQKEGQKLSNNTQDKNVVSFKNTMREKLSKLVDHIDVDAAADSMSVEFISSRLPPFEYVPKEDYIAPTLEDKIQIRFKDHVKLIYCTEDDGINQSMFEDAADTEGELTEEEDTEDEVVDMEEKPEKTPPQKEETDDDDDEDADADDEMHMDSCIKILSSLKNNRNRHMAGDSDKKAWNMKLPLHYASAMTHLLSTNSPTLVKNLPGLEDENDKLFLATNLYDGDIVDVNK